MKKVIGIFVAGLLSIILLIYIARPNVPPVSGLPDYDAGVYCLREVPKKYSPDYFTFKAWIMRWYAHHADKWGIKMSPNLLSFYRQYIDLEFDIDCYIQLSNDPGLNMALSPTEFKAVYNVIAENHDLQKIE